MASPLNNFEFPHYPPPPPPPPPSDDGSNTVTVIVFVSLGGLLFLAFLAIALCCFIKKKKTVQETDIVHVDERLKVKEAVVPVPGPHGPEAVVLAVEDDVHVEEEILKKEKSPEGTQAKSVDVASQEGGSNTHGRGHDHLDHK